MIPINQQVLEFFRKHDRMSAFRVYAYVKHHFNNHLHSSQFNQIQRDLQISRQVLLKSIRQLIELEICYLHCEGYWRFRSRRKFAPSRKNRITDIKLEDLRSLKFLRSLFYYFKYKSSYFISKKNYKSSVPVKLQRSSGFHDVSASFVKKVTSIDVSVQTLLKHLKRCEEFNLISRKPLQYLTHVEDKNKFFFNQKVLAYDPRNIIGTGLIVRRGQHLRLIEYLPYKVRPLV